MALAKLPLRKDLQQQQDCKIAMASSLVMLVSNSEVNSKRGEISSYRLFAKGMQAVGVFDTASRQSENVDDSQHIQVCLISPLQVNNSDTILFGLSYC
ncbi:hypothetical protein J6590_044494 [Homalodisca vitripennis]|nr:hypothetical protein J6590_044494 [Homalodisca vitripennis]